MRQRDDGTFQWGRIATLARQLESELQPSSPAYSRFVALKLIEADIPVGLRWRLSLELQQAFIEALHDHVHSLTRDESCRPLPEDMASFLIDAFERAMTGESSPIFEKARPAKGFGNTRTINAQKRIDDAVDYLVAVDERLLHDRASRTTVAKCYGVSRQQVSRWLQRVGDRDERRTRFRERWQRYILATSNDTVSQFLDRLMRESGKEYRRLRLKRG